MFKNKASLTIYSRSIICQRYEMNEIITDIIGQARIFWEMQVEPRKAIFIIWFSKVFNKS